MDSGGKLIGVLGGLGPWATEEFLRLVLEETEAACDQDYPDLLIMNRSSTPDRTAFLLGRSENSPGPVIAADARRLERAGCAALVIPCNTSHQFYGEVASAVSIPVLHLIREVAAEGKRRGMHTLGVLCTEGTRRTDLYGRTARELGMDCLYPSESAQRRVTSLIYDSVKAGLPPRREELTAAFDELLSRGCEGLVLGCTELPIAYRALHLQQEYPMALDSLRILARRTVEAAGKRLRPAQP
ncbi:MAG: aspartate/glutamate racemase family protein [Oscillospiraceae bacterium]